MLLTHWTTRNWNLSAKQVGQLAPGYWTAPFVAARFLIYAYAHLQISFRLYDHLVMYLLGYRFCASFSFFFFHPRPNGRNINARSSCSITHCQTPVRKLVSGGLTKKEVESHSHFLSSYFKHAWICCHNCSLMKENQAVKIQIDSLSDTGYSFEYVPTPLAAGGVGMYVKDCLKYIRW